MDMSAAFADDQGYSRLGREGSHGTQYGESLLLRTRGHQPTHLDGYPFATLAASKRRAYAFRS